MSVRRVLIQSYSTPLDPPWPSAEGPVHRREGSILILEDDDGRVGLGETAPWPGFGLETHASSVAALRLAARRLVGLPVDAYLAAAGDLLGLAPVAASPCARHAIDLALHDLAAQRAGVSIARLLGGESARTEVTVNATIPRVPARETAEAARQFAEAGFGTLKLKVGGVPLDEDVARLRAVREAVGPSLHLRIDANQAWSEGDALASLAAFREFDLEYCEQPVAADEIDSMARVRAAGGVRIAADESVRDAAKVKRILAAGAADVLVLKPMALGGLHAARSIAAAAAKAGVPVVVTSLLEGPIGRTGALHLAASLGPGPYAHGVAPEPVHSPVVHVPGRPGLGAEPNLPLQDVVVLAAADEVASE
jgi:o-succinylbenzoate synthase